MAAETGAPKSTAVSDSESSDGRSAARRSCVQFVWYRSIEDGSTHGLARTVDVSAGGLGFVTTHRMAHGERFFVVVVTRFGRVALLGKVIHVQEAEPGLYRAGLQIEIIPPTDKATWQRLQREEPR